MKDIKLSTKNKSRLTLPYGVCVVACAPVRKLPDHASEMITQLLLGECMEVITKKHNAWMRIRCIWDDYIGWIDSKQVIRISKEECEAYTTDPVHCLDTTSMLSSKQKTFPILIGSKLPLYDGLHCHLPDIRYIFNGLIIQPTKLNRITSDLLLRVATKYIHAPYLRGGRSIFGIDASGFVQVVFQMIGLQLPRDATKQVDLGRTVDFISMSLPGDVAFFENDKKQIIHVGILMGNSKIIHSFGKVRIDNIDEQGIYNTVQKKYTHKLRIAKRVFNFHVEE